MRKVCGCCGGKNLSEWPCEECMSPEKCEEFKEKLYNIFYREYLLYCNKTEDGRLIDTGTGYAS